MKDSREIEEIEEIVKNSFENFEFQAPNSAWLEIEKGLKPLNAKIVRKRRFKYIGIAASMLLIAGASYYSLTNLSADKSVHLTKADVVEHQLKENEKLTFEKEKSVSIVSNETTKETISKIANSKQLKEQSNEVSTEKEIETVPNLDQSIQLTEKETFVSEDENNLLKTTIESTTNLEVVNNELTEETSIDAVRVYDVSEKAIAIDKKIKVNQIDIESISFQNIAPAKITFKITGVSEADFESIDWDFGDGNISTDFKSGNLFTEEGTYDVILNGVLKDGQKVYKELSVEITKKKELYIANAFSPNGDGINDYFEISNEEIVDFHLIVFGLDNSIVFESYDKSKIWDGTDKNGIPLKEGSYVYQVIAKLANDEVHHFNKRILLQR